MNEEDLEVFSTVPINIKVMQRSDNLLMINHSYVYDILEIIVKSVKEVILLVCWSD